MVTKTTATSRRVTIDQVFLREALELHLRALSIINDNEVVVINSLPTKFDIKVENE